MWDDNFHSALDRIERDATAAGVTAAIICLALAGALTWVAR